MSEKYTIYEKGDRINPDRESLMERGDLNAELIKQFELQISKMDMISLRIVANLLDLEIERFITDIDEIVRFANRMVELYASSRNAVNLSFGEWLVKYQYPNSDTMDRSIRDMCTTARTSDARTWFIANLQSGKFSILEESQIVR